MKRFTLIFAFVCTITGTAMSQGKIPASIFIIDQQTNATVQASSDAANLFKVSLINLVANTSMAKLASVTNFGPGKRSIVITQADPQQNGNAYQLVMQRSLFGNVNVIYTFQYNVDQNKLYYYDPNSQQWLDQAIQGDNVLNLNNCQNYGMFNAVQQQAAAPADNTPQPAPADDATAPDTSVQVAVIPPALPDYEQPECPTEGYLWQPGYWAYSVDTQGYYWVPGVWVAPPTIGYLWTPPYWGFVGGLYIFHTGYWGESVGFYGGIDYGYGYGGSDFVGGRWDGGHFRYNTAIVRVNANFHYRYEDRSVYRERGRGRFSFNGRGGYNARPNQHEMAAMHEHHVMATNEQIRNQRAAREDKTAFAAHNGGRPGNLAMARAPERSADNGRTAGSMNEKGAPNNRGGNTAARPGGAGETATRPGTPGAAGVGVARPGAAGTMGAGAARPGGAPGTTGAARAGAPGGRPMSAPGAPGAKTGGNAPKTAKAPKINSNKKK